MLQFSHTDVFPCRDRPVILEMPGRQRGMAQLGSARRSGRRGRRFKSCYPDQLVMGGLNAVRRSRVAVVAPSQSAL